MQTILVWMRRSRTTNTLVIVSDYTSIKSNIQFNDAWEWLCKEVLRLDEIDIPEEERELPILDNAAEEMKHNLLLKFYRQYLNDSGVIYTHAMANLYNTSFHFLVADGPETFNTSDNPVFVFRRLDGKLQGVLPLSPRILMAQGRNSEHDENFYVTHITDGFLFEEDGNVLILQLADVFQAVQCVSGKSADGLGDNHVDVSGLAVVNHTVKVLTFFGVGAGNTIIGVDTGKFPFGVFLHKFCIMLDLSIVACSLLIAVSTDSAIRCDSKLWLCILLPGSVSDLPFCRDDHNISHYLTSLSIRLYRYSACMTGFS